MDLKGHNAGVQGVTFSGDGKSAASVSKDGTWKMWSIDGVCVYVCGCVSYVVLAVWERRRFPKGKAFLDALQLHIVKRKKVFLLCVRVWYSGTLVYMHL